MIERLHLQKKQDKHVSESVFPFYYAGVASSWCMINPQTASIKRPFASFAAAEIPQCIIQTKELFYVNL